jgi:hypothetical protein
MNAPSSVISLPPEVFTQQRVHAKNSSNPPTTSVNLGEDGFLSGTRTHPASLFTFNSALVVATPKPELTVALSNPRKSSVSLEGDGVSPDSCTRSSISPPRSPYITGGEPSLSWWLKYCEDIAHALQGTLSLVADVVEGLPVAKAVLKLAATGVNRLEVCLFIDIPKTLLIHSSRQVGRMKQKPLTSPTSLPSS